MLLPDPRSISLRRVWCFARKPSIPPGPMPSTPTQATSPSIRALVAWVVLWATKITSSGAISFSLKQFWNAFTTPAATPYLSSCVVLTEDFPMISCVALSIATAFVWVPPTSIPILTSLFPMFLLLPLTKHDKCNNLQDAADNPAAHHAHL